MILTWSKSGSWKWCFWTSLVGIDEIHVAKGGGNAASNDVTVMKQKMGVAEWVMKWQQSLES